jgi:ankyrin repeat protein
VKKLLILAYCCLVAALLSGARLLAADSPLHQAVYRDDLPAVKRLLAQGADARATNHYGVAPISLACRNGNAEMLELLLKAGADPNTTSAGGETALMTAARTGKVRAVRLLLEHRADVNAKERRGQTAIMWAAAEGHTDVVRALIEAGAEFKTPLDSGFTPLTFAVREGYKETALALIDAGADVNAAMEPKHAGGRSVRKGTSPFLLAVENGHFELALALLDKGADPNDARSGFTALHVLSWVRKPNRGEEPEALPPPDGAGNVTSLEFVREIVARGADVNARLKISGGSGKGEVTRSGATPFFLAAGTDDLPLMKLLVELGADPKIPNADGTTPLMTAAGLGVLAPGEEGGTEDEAVEAVKYAVQLGLDVNAVDTRGETAMHGAAYKGAPRIVHLLAEDGAKIDIWNRTNKWGWTPITIAEGFRPGNFRPSFETLDALHAVMRAAGMAPPPPTPRFATAAAAKEEWPKAAAKKTAQ